MKAVERPRFVYQSPLQLKENYSELGNENKSPCNDQANTNQSEEPLLGHLGPGQDRLRHRCAVCVVLRIDKSEDYLGKQDEIGYLYEGEETNVLLAAKAKDHCAAVYRHQGDNRERDK